MLTKLKDFYTNYSYQKHITYIKQVLGKNFYTCAGFIQKVSVRVSESLTCYFSQLAWCFTTSFVLLLWFLAVVLVDRVTDGYFYAVFESWEQQLVHQSRSFDFTYTSMFVLGVEGILVGLVLVLVGASVAGLVHHGFVRVGLSIKYFAGCTSLFFKWVLLWDFYKVALLFHLIFFVSPDYDGTRYLHQLPSLTVMKTSRVAVFSLFDEVVQFEVSALGLVLTVLTGVILFLVKFFSYCRLDQMGLFRVGVCFSCCFFLELFLILLFSCNNLIIFFIMLELTLLPLVFLIILYGKQPRRVRATFLLFNFTFLGSFFVLLGIFFGFFVIQSFNIHKWGEFVGEAMQSTVAPYGGVQVRCVTPRDIQLLTASCFFFFLGFCLKLPIVPFHAWLVEAHVEASTEGSVILASLILKTSSFGLVQIVYGVFFSQGFGVFWLQPLAWSLGFYSIFLSVFYLRVQVDLKKIVAYSSILHMNVALIGLFSGVDLCLVGALITYVSHTLISGALFFLVGLLYERGGSRLVTNYAGVRYVMPIFAGWCLFFVFANLDIPPFFSFLGDVFILVGLTKLSLGLVIFFMLPSSLLYTVVFFTVTQVVLDGGDCTHGLVLNMRICSMRLGGDISMGDVLILVLLAFCLFICLLFFWVYLFIFFVYGAGSCLWL